MFFLCHIIFYFFIHSFSKELENLGKNCASEPWLSQGEQKGPPYRLVDFQVENCFNEMSL